MHAPYSCPEQTSYSWDSTLTPYPIASLERTTCIDPPRTRMKSISSRRRCRAGFHNQRDNPSWVLPQDIPLHTRSITSIPPRHTVIFNGFSHRQNKRVVTCPFLQANYSSLGSIRFLSHHPHKSLFIDLSFGMMLLDPGSPSRSKK